MGSGELLPCHININCPEAEEWQIEKQAVVAILRDGKLASGALMNNTLNDKTPYILTAHHIVHKANNNEIVVIDPSEYIFYFNYENPQCTGGAGQKAHFLSGSTLRASAFNNDFALLEVNAPVPSSFQSFFVGWNRHWEVPDGGVVISHPVGHPKKIGFLEPSTITTNSTNVGYNLGGPFAYNLVPGVVFEAEFDQGIVQSGSSGSPMFNLDGKVVGHTVASDIVIVCPEDGVFTTYFSRINQNWTFINSPQFMLQPWLDPTNNSSIWEIDGYAPQGWIHDWVGGWDAPSYTKVYNQTNVIKVGEGNQVFYKGIDNKIQTYYWDNGTWNHGWVGGWDAPSYQNITGSMAVGTGNHIFYRGNDGKLQTYYWDNDQWNHGWVGGWDAPSNRNISDKEGAIVVSASNKVYYRGVDNKLQVYYWENSQWNHGWLGGWNAPSNQNVAGDIVYGNSSILYRGTDGRLHTYYWHNSAWHHAWVDSWDAPSNRSISLMPGSISLRSGGSHVFYRGVDNKLQAYYWSNGNWHHAWIGGWDAPTFANISGQIAVGENSEVIYRGNDGRMHIYYWSVEHSNWIHDWLENSWQAPSLNNVQGSIAIGANNHVFYRGSSDGKCRIYYWENEFFRSSSGRYSMSEVAPSPTINVRKVKEDLLQINVTPNPANSIINIQVFAKNEGNIPFVIYNQYGKRVYFENKRLDIGLSDFSVDISQFAAGVYYIVTGNSEDNITSKTFVKL